MDLSVNEFGEVVLKRVYSPVILKSDAVEQLSICMRDGGFEFTYMGVPYFAKGGVVGELKLKNELKYDIS